MKLFTSEIRRKLLKNGQDQQEAQRTGSEIDHWPVVKVFTPDAGCTWLLSEVDPDEPDIAFGLCDLGMGSPELGSVRLSELEQITGKLGLPAERDLFFEASKPLIEYAREAWSIGRIAA